MDKTSSNNNPGHDQHTDAMVRLTRHWSKALPTIEAFVCAVVNDPHDREDVIQDTSAYIASHFSDYQEGTSFANWAVTIARFRVKELFRDRSRERLILSGDAMGRIADTAVRLQGEVGDRQDALSHCMERLPENQRRLLDMRYTQAMKPAAIAQEVGKTSKLVSGALLRIRGALRDCIETRLEAQSTDRSSK